MTSGNVNGAIRRLEDSKKGILQMNTNTIHQLEEKHPKAEPLYDDLLIQGDKPEVSSIIFDSIDGELIGTIALRSNGTAGSSNLDSDSWKKDHQL